MWQCDLLPSSPSPISGISLHAISPQLPTPCYPSPSPNRPCCVMFPSLCPCVLIVQHPLWVRTCGVRFSVLVLVCWEWWFPASSMSLQGHDLILFYGCIVFHGVCAPHFLYPVYHWWAFGLVPRLCYCEQCRNKHRLYAGFLLILLMHVPTDWREGLRNHDWPDLGHMTTWKPGVDETEATFPKIMTVRKIGLNRACVFTMEWFITFWVYIQ